MISTNVESLIYQKQRYYLKDFKPYQNDTGYILFTASKWYVMPDDNGKVNGRQLLPWRLIVPKGVFKNAYKVNDKIVQTSKACMIGNFPPHGNYTDPMTYYKDSTFQVVPCVGVDGDYWIANNVSVLYGPTGTSNNMVSNVKLWKGCVSAVWRPGESDTYANYNGETGHGPGHRTIDDDSDCTGLKI